MSSYFGIFHTKIFYPITFAHVLIITLISAQAPMNLTYEINAVFKNLFNQTPIDVYESNDPNRPVEFTFSNKIDALVFHQYFSSLENPDESLKNNSIILGKKDIGRFNNIIATHFQAMEMQANHKKYAAVLPQVLNNKIESLEQLAYDTTISIWFTDKIDEKKFNNYFMMEKYTFSLAGNELTILSDGYTAFNKQIDFLYVDLTQNLLTQQNEKSFSLKMFG